MDFFAPGKLMLTGEYSVLAGAECLVIPTRFGQHLKTQTSHNSSFFLHWIARDWKGSVWLDVYFNRDLEVLGKSSLESSRLQSLLKAALAQSSVELEPGTVVETKLDFHRQWGLGSSSTLVALIAQWLKIDPMSIFFDQLSGSGYDVACGFVQKPLLYQLESPRNAVWKITETPRIFGESSFVYLGQKQDSAREVKRFSTDQLSDEAIKEITRISYKILEAKTLQEAISLLHHHEELTAEFLGRKRIQDQLFPDFKGLVKSLGAWGGDYVWVWSEELNHDYFIEKGFSTVYAYNQMAKG